METQTIVAAIRGDDEAYGVNQVHDQLIQAKPRVADMPIPNKLDDHIQKDFLRE